MIGLSAFYFRQWATISTPLTQENILQYTCQELISSVFHEDNWVQHSLK